MITSLCYTASAQSLLGGREEQQDAYCLERRRGELLAAVCDGIGGLPDGAEASRSAVQALLTTFHKNPQAAPSYLYRQAIDWMDRAVAEQTAGGGSTIVSVWVRSGGLYWLSIGDSGLFLLRGGSLQRLVPEHNYAALLK